MAAAITHIPVVVDVNNGLVISGLLVQLPLMLIVVPVLSNLLRGGWGEVSTRSFFLGPLLPSGNNGSIRSHCLSVSSIGTAPMRDSPNGFGFPAKV